MTLPVGTLLGSYEILASIGAGGMGEVYRARDSKLDRDVAIKVLPPSVAGDPDALARFEREAKAVAALSHPNILAIFDFGTRDGRTYAVMELLQGDTLRDRLLAGPIFQRQAVDYALQLAKGLSAAHEKGIVHRDLKPENIFVTRDGHLKILDFGLAKRTEPMSPDAATCGPTMTGRTEPGTVMGTMGYMSPEQVRGQPVDQRSDIFAFGAILYELLTGQRAFGRDTPSDSMAAIMRDEPPDFSASGRGVSPALDSIVRHCLEKNRENRFQSAKDIAFALSETSTSSSAISARSPAPDSLPVRKRRIAPVIAAGVVLLALAASLIVFRRRFSSGNGEGQRVQRIAVLPFENLGAPEDGYFADGIADEVRAKLTTLPDLQVIARASSTPYKKTTKTPKEIAEELNVAYLLTATVRWEKSGGLSRVHVTPDLVDVTRPDAPTSKWQQPFDAALTDVFQVQSEIASRVAGALGVALGANRQRQLVEKPTQNLAAYDAYLKGNEVQALGGGTDPATARNALAFYERAVALDPKFVQAWKQLSYTAGALYSNGTPTRALAQRTLQAAETALALAPDRSDGYEALGAYERMVTNDIGRAAKHYEEARRLAPGESEFLFSTALVEQGLGRWPASLNLLHRAEELSPRSTSTKRTLGFTLLRMRQYPEARAALDRAFVLSPKNLDAIEYKAMTYLAEGNLPRARAVLKAASAEVDASALVAEVANYYDLAWVFDEEQRDLLLRLTPSAFDDDRGQWAISLAQAYALRGDTASARRYAEQAAEAVRAQLVSVPQDAGRHMSLSVAYAYCGRKGEAIREGERAIALDPVAKDQYWGPYVQHQLARVYILTGEPRKALEQLEPLLKVPYYLSPGWLEIDPTFEPLRNNPRFRKLVASGK